jgi:hypothetical protein
MKAVDEANNLILSQRDDLHYSDNGDASRGGRMRDNSVWTESKVNFSDFAAIRVSALKENTMHPGCVLSGKIIVPPVILKSLMTFIEDQHGDIVMVAVYNFIPPDIKGRELIDYANSKLRKGDFLSILDPFFKIFVDGTRGVRVECPSKLSFGSCSQTISLDKPDAGKKIEGSKSNIDRKEDSIQIGARVRIHDLQSRPDLNGVCGIVEQVQSNGRRVVRFDQSLPVVSVRLGNLVIQDAGMISEESPCNPAIPRTSESGIGASNSNDRVATERCLSLKEEGNEHLRNGRPSEASSSYTEAISLIQDYAVQPDEFNTNIPEVQRAVEEPLRDQLCLLFCNRSMARLQLGEAAAALSDAAAALRLDVGWTKARLRAAEAALALGFTEQATEFLQSGAYAEGGSGGGESGARMAGVAALRSRVEGAAAKPKHSFSNT